MANLSDHLRRDANKALHSEIQVFLTQYSRRMFDEGKALVVEAIAKAGKEGKAVNGIATGKAIAARVITDYFGPEAKPESAIDAAASDCPLIEAGNENP